MTNSATIHEVKVSPVSNDEVYKDASSKYYELTLVYTPNDGSPTICEKAVLPVRTNKEKIMTDLTDQQLNALKRAACEWVLAEHPFFTDKSKTDADWAAWFDAVQEGKIDFDEPALDEEGNETGYRAVYLAEDYENYDEAYALDMVFTILHCGAKTVLKLEDKPC